MCRWKVFTSFTVLVRVFVQICIYCRTNNRQTYWLSWTTQKNRRTGQKPHFLDQCPHRTVNCEGRLVSSYFLRFHKFEPTSLLKTLKWKSLPSRPLWTLTFFKGFKFRRDLLVKSPSNPNLCVLPAPAPDTATRPSGQHCTKVHYR